MIFVYLIALFIIIFSVRVLLTKKDYEDIKRLELEFDKWLKDDNCKRPNSYEFKLLFEKLPNAKSMIVEVMEAGRIVRASVVDSFPSKDDYLSIKQSIYLSSMKDYFYLKYKTNFSITFWIKFYIFLPQQVIRWLGVKTNTFTERLLTLIYWIIGGMFFILKPVLLHLINHLLR